MGQLALTGTHVAVSEWYFCISSTLGADVWVHWRINVTLAATLLIALTVPGSAAAAAGVEPLDSPASAVSSLGSTRSTPTGSIVVGKTKPVVKFVLTSTTGRKIQLSTAKPLKRSVPAGRYTISSTSIPGYWVELNAGKSTLQVRPGSVIRVPVKVMRLAALRLKSVTTDGERTTVRVAASRAVSAQVQFLNTDGRVAETRVITVPKASKVVTVTWNGVAAQVRAKPLKSPGEEEWIISAPQVSLLTTTQPDVTVGAGQVAISAPVSSSSVSVERVDVSSDTIVGGISAEVRGGSLTIQDTPPGPGAYQYRISGVNAAGDPVTTTLAVGVPDASGNGLAVMAPNLTRVSVGAIEFPSTGTGLIAIPIASLPGDVIPKELVGNPIIAATRTGDLAALGYVVELRDGRVWVRQTGIYTLMQQFDITGFVPVGSGDLSRKGPQPRTFEPECTTNLTLGIPRASIGFTPRSDLSRWRGYIDGADFHVEGNFALDAKLTLTGFSTGLRTTCSLIDIPPLLKQNISIPTPVGPIPTILTGTPVFELVAETEFGFATFERTYTIAVEFNYSVGWNGPKLHTQDPFSATSTGPPGLEPVNPRASITLEAGFDFAYGLGLDIPGLGGVQVGGLSLQVGGGVSLTMATGASKGQPDKGTCLSVTVSLGQVTIELKTAAAWNGTSAGGLPDIKLREFDGVTVLDVNLTCWGDPNMDPPPNPTPDPGGEEPGDTSPSALQITAGSAHTCVLRSGGGVECWGRNYYGQLGNGATRSNSATPVPVKGLSGALQIAAGENHTCAILSDGIVQCWGLNGSGQLGDGTRSNRPVPVTVKGISGAQRIAAGDNHTCAILSDGTLKCWGYNGSGQLGDGTTEDRLAPVSVQGISGAQRIAAGRFDTCAVVAGGTVQCWGMSRQPYFPGPVPGRGGIPDAREIAMGGSHKCALVSDGIAKCWGSNSEGQFGNGTTGDNPAPAAARGVAGARKIAAGGAHTCAILSRGTVKCWGRNSAGQLGDGSTQGHLTPVVVKGISGAQQIAAGTGHTCAIVTDSVVKCWGSNSEGQLGSQSAAPSGFLSVIK